MGYGQFQTSRVIAHQVELANDATSLLVAADTALYFSKEAGRDRVTVAFS